MRLVKVFSPKKSSKRSWDPESLDKIEQEIKIRAVVLRLF
jgi:hypothetical protein